MAAPLRRADRPLLTAVERSLASANLLASPTTLVVGVSGGPDSVCLLHLLTRIALKRPLTLFAAHLDHGLRGREGEEDAEAVSDLCRELDVPCIIGSHSVPAYRAAHPDAVSSIEAAAREVRYAFFASVAQQTGADVVAVAHTADDQSETVLLHLIRGAGISGLGGMSELTAWQSTTGTLHVLRPLLNIPRAQTHDYCRRHRLPSRVDSSNADLRYTRNRIRLETLPALRAINPSVDTALQRLASLARDDERYLLAQTDALWPLLAKVHEDGVRLDKRGLKRQPAALQRRVIQRASQTLTGSAEGLELAHVDAALALLSATPGKHVPLNASIVASAAYNELWLTQSRTVAGEKLAIAEPKAFAIPGTTEWGAWKLHSLVHEGAYLPSHTDALHAYLDALKAGGPLRVRARRPGDRYRPLGMDGPQKLQDLLVNQRIPRPLRDLVPVVVAGKEILWLAGHRVTEEAKVRPETAATLEIVAEPCTADAQALLRIWQP